MTGRHRGGRPSPVAAGQGPAPAVSQADPAGARPSSHPMTLISSADDFDGGVSPGALVQWVIRFAQDPAMFAWFVDWVHGIWPECGYSDAEIAGELRRLHDLFTRVLRAGD